MGGRRTGNGSRSSLDKRDAPLSEARSHGMSDPDLNSLRPAVPSSERAAKCRRMAAEAEGMARRTTGETREAYLTLLKQWIALAEELERMAETRS